MTPLDRRDAAALDTLVGDCRRLFGVRLVAVALYGEAASEAYRPRASPLDAVLLLDHVRTADLRTLRERVDAWYRQRLGTPLVVDAAYLATSRDVFPLELLELRDRHRLLHGTEDPFATLGPPSLPHLRLEIEEQLKGKLLHFRESYIALGHSRRGLDALLAATMGMLDVVLRGMLALAERARPARPAEVIRAVEEVYGLELSGLARLESWRRDGARRRRLDLEALADAAHDELAALACRIDRR